MKEINTTSGDDRQPGVEFKPRADLFRMFMTHTPAAVAMCDIKMRFKYLCQCLAGNAHRGNADGIITAQCEKGQGTTFNIYLPACA